LFVLFFCTNAKVPIRKETKLSSTESIKCSLCHIITTYVEDFVAKNQSQAFIIKELDNLCNALPVSFRPPCQQIVDDYAPKLIKWILNKENPDAFCLSVHLCDSTDVELPKLEIPKLPKVELKVNRPDNPVGCALCQAVILYVEKWVVENSTEQAIIDRLDTFCNALGHIIAPECQSLVAVYLPQMIQHILNKEDPMTFCTQIRVCSSTQQFPQTFMKRTEEQGACEICQMIVTYVEQLVAQNSTVKVIVQKVEDLCALLPKSIAPICDNIASTYVPKLVVWLANKENPEAFCAHFGLC